MNVSFGGAISLLTLIAMALFGLVSLLALYHVRFYLIYVTVAPLLVGELAVQRGVAVRLIGCAQIAPRHSSAVGRSHALNFL